MVRLGKGVTSVVLVVVVGSTTLARTVTLARLAVRAVVAVAVVAHPTTISTLALAVRAAMDT